MSIHKHKFEINVILWGGGQRRRGGRGEGGGRGGRGGGGGRRQARVAQPQLVGDRLDGVQAGVQLRARVRGRQAEPATRARYTTRCNTRRNISSRERNATNNWIVKPKDESFFVPGVAYFRSGAFGKSRCDKGVQNGFKN